MSCRREIPKQEIPPDPKFDNVEVAKLISVLMLDGRKSVAERIVYGVFDRIEEKIGKASIEVFMLTIGNIKLMVEVKSCRVGGANYQVSAEVRPSRRLALVMRWLWEAAKRRNERSTALRLAGELLEALEGHGSVMKKRDEIRHMTEASKTFSYFRL